MASTKIIDLAKERRVRGLIVNLEETVDRNPQKAMQAEFWVRQELFADELEKSNDVDLVLQELKGLRFLDK